ncbi:hypothetical protein ACFFU8_09605 [Chromobacterium piscinae]|uniref:hypothetical protein n=1 Tax=Chromobacterium piscinae TaxID=686831 RepID=UPI001E29BC42|nr:hypothetical protein [Chromobacterium piscinae]MCD5327840.1 hypothetical protein [Chromobacterium piscinae]
METGRTDIVGIDELGVLMYLQDLLERLTAFSDEMLIRDAITLVESTHSADLATPQALKGLIDQIWGRISRVLDCSQHGVLPDSDLFQLESELADQSGQLQQVIISRAAADQWALLQMLAEEGILVSGMDKLLALLETQMGANWRRTFMLCVAESRGVQFRRQLFGRDEQAISRGLLDAGFDNNDVKMFLCTVRPTMRAQISVWLAQPKVSVGLKVLGFGWEIACSAKALALFVVMVLRWFAIPYPSLNQLLPMTRCLPGWSVWELLAGVVIFALMCELPAWLTAVARQLLASRPNTGYSPSKAKLR